jgi:hypothetical protein
VKALVKAGGAAKKAQPEKLLAWEAAGFKALKLSGRLAAKAACLTNVAGAEHG